MVPLVNENLGLCVNVNELGSKRRIFGLMLGFVFRNVGGIDRLAAAII